MRVVIQRVTKASVTVEKKIVGLINQGLLVLLGIETEDSLEDCLLYTSPSPRDMRRSRMPSSA